jgi:hypothetical protein
VGLEQAARLAHQIVNERGGVSLEQLDRSRLGSEHPGQRGAVEVVAGGLAARRVRLDQDAEPPLLGHADPPLHQAGAATRPSRTASIRLSIEPTLTRLTCSGVRKPATILATGADRVPLADAPESPVVLPPHANIRGRAYYTLSTVAQGEPLRVAHVEPG